MYFILLVLVATCITAFASPIRHERKDFIYSLDLDSTDNIVVTIEKYLGNDKVLTLPGHFTTADGVTYPVVAIGESAFEGNRTIHSVTVPEPINLIGKFAFAGTDITKVDMPATLKKIDQQAFADTPLDTVIVRAPTPPSAWGLLHFDSTNTTYWIDFGDIFSRIISISYKFESSGNYESSININGSELSNYYSEFRDKYLNKKIDATLFVPGESMALYNNTYDMPFNGGYTYAPWSRFARYDSLENITNAIDNIFTETQRHNEDVYDISGRCVLHNYDGASPLYLKSGIYLYKGKKLYVK